MYDPIYIEKKGRASRDGVSKRARSSDPCVISTVLYLLSYTYIWVLCREAPEREFVFVHSEDTRIKAHRAYLFYLYTAHSVDGRRSVHLLRTSTLQFVYLI